MSVEASKPAAAEERCEPQAVRESADEEGDQPDPDLPSKDVVPCTVWFGPKGSASVEREMFGYLGSHGGVAVLQWPRDAERATHCSVLGIPNLCFVADPIEPSRCPEELREWLPSKATDREVHESLCRLSKHGASTRSAALLALDSDGLRLGDGEVPLAPPARELAAVLIANFEWAVDDDSLSRAVNGATRTPRPFLGELLQLDRDVKQLGLEIVPVKEHAHLMRRCGR
jgi:hypothetical protein